MTKHDRDKISERIKKLLSLGKSANEHEAKLAMKRASELMTKYQIEEADLLVNVSPDMIAREDVSIQGKRRQWVITLAWACAKLFDCDVVAKGGGYSGTNFMVFGRPEDVSSTKFMFNHLFTSWTSIVEHDFEIWKKKQWDTPRGSSLQFKTSHGAGYAYALNDRAEQMVRERNKNLIKASHNAALVPVNTALAVKNKISEELGKLGKAECASVGSREGAAAGRAAGKNIPLGGAVEGNAGYIQ